MPKTSEQQPANATIQSSVMLSGNTVGGNMKIVNITVSASLTPEQKREERHQEIAFQLQQKKEERLKMKLFKQI